MKPKERNRLNSLIKNIKPEYFFNIRCSLNGRVISFDYPGVPTFVIKSHNPLITKEMISDSCFDLDGYVRQLSKDSLIDLLFDEEYIKWSRKSGYKIKKLW